MFRKFGFHADAVARNWHQVTDTVAQKTSKA